MQARKQQRDRVQTAQGGLMAPWPQAHTSPVRKQSEPPGDRPAAPAPRRRRRRLQFFGLLSR